jgi:hypothetical protein
MDVASMAEVEENHGICPVFKCLIIDSEVFNIAVPAVWVIWRRINCGTRREFHVMFGTGWSQSI